MRSKSLIESLLLHEGYGRLLAQSEKDGYTVSIYWPRGPLGLGRRGIETITHDGVEVRAGYWMDYPEVHWKISDSDYKKLPIETRAKMECDEQLRYDLKQEFEDGAPKRIRVAPAHLRIRPGFKASWQRS